MKSSHADRFWSKVEKSDGCWLWKGARQTNGYGSFSVGGRRIVAHRWIYETLHGALPKDVDCCHSCDVRLCVNPAHLFAGSRSDNMWDASRKGRVPGQSKTHCVRGHPLSGDNLGRDNRGHRRCRTCQRASVYRHDAKRRGYIDALASGKGERG